MRHLIQAICCAAVLALAPSNSHAQSTWAGYRAPPATEPSVVIADKPATPALEKVVAVAPKPVVRHKIVRRPGKGPAGPVNMPPHDVLIMMVRGALASINQANFAENYSVLHAMTTPALQARVTPAQFGRAFANLRKQNLDLSPALILAPQFTTPPVLTSQGTLKLVGIVPSQPMQIVFAIDYLPIDGFWLIDSLTVSAQPSGTAMQTASLAPTAPQPTQPAVTQAVAQAGPQTMTPMAPPAPSVQAAPPPIQQTARTARKSGFWEARFVRTTHFGPNLNFVSLQ